MTARQFAASNLIACAAPAYLRQRRPRVPEDLERHDCLIYRGAAWLEEWPFTRDGVTTKVKLDARLLSNDNAYLTRAAVAGAGLTIQPSFNVWRELKSGALERVLADWQVDELRLHVVFPQGRYLPPKVRAFVDLLIEAFQGGRSDHDIWLERAQVPAATITPIDRMVLPAPTVARRVV